ALPIYDVRVDGGDREDPEAEAEQLDDDARREDVPPVEDAARHRGYAMRLRAAATSRNSASRIAGFAACTTLHRPSTRRRSRIGRPSKSTDRPSAPATIGIAGI